MERIYQSTIALLTVVCLISATQLSGAHDEQRQATLINVYTVCNDSRISAEISETECGNLQDTTDTEFLCTANNMSPANHCWVEDKRK